MRQATRQQHSLLQTVEQQLSKAPTHLPIGLAKQVLRADSAHTASSTEDCAMLLSINGIAPQLYTSIVLTYDIIQNVYQPVLSAVQRRLQEALQLIGHKRARASPEIRLALYATMVLSIDFLFFYFYFLFWLTTWGLLKLHMMRVINHRKLSHLKLPNKHNRTHAHKINLKTTTKVLIKVW